MSVSHGFGDSRGVFPPSTVLDTASSGQKPWPSPRSEKQWPSTSKGNIFQESERLLPPSDMVLSLMQGQNESFMADPSKLPCDVMRYQSVPTSFHSSSAELKNENLSQVSRSMNESSHLNGTLPVVFSSQISPLHPSISIMKNNLTRHRSSPAMLLSQLAVDAHGVTGSNGEVSSTQLSGPYMRSSTGDFSAGVPSDNIGLTGIAEASPELTTDIDGSGWDGSAMSHGSSLMSMLDDISPGRKRYGELEGDQTIDASRFETEGKASESTSGLLTRHLSLPVVSNRENDLVSGDNWLQDSVPCRLRAKRGCATHPRSIAERVRRTRISERMRKLQELVPNMDKQTNITDMLDEAIEYVKFLQRQVQELSQSTSRCQGFCKLDVKSNQQS
ncbi:hypothetical protein O6H91_11G064500 [Diphasiastrum complanatum]|uniref:Uncharacterized protein n=1 Tax=Diphasiastrum complanatum TaxID=34168 RepID=A0ACC2CA24_DIPCM|nr:hypothetical protein O6H91_11G064500 [Diphasiastrum complanatum]